MAKILPKIIEAIMMDCLYLPGENTDDAVTVEGITTTFGFHPGRLESNRKRIEEMLSCLPDPFMADKGGGMSFLEACNDNEGEQWTGFHHRMEELFVLGMAIGHARYCMPRDFWSVLPGGMPYIQVGPASEKSPVLEDAP